MLSHCQLQDSIFHIIMRHISPLQIISASCMQDLDHVTVLSCYWGRRRQVIIKLTARVAQHRHFCARQTALERQDLSRTYLAYHELEDVIINNNIYALL